MIQALLLDFDGVLRLWDGQYDARAEQAVGLSDAAIRAVAFAPELLQPAITGTISDEQWRAEVVARLRLRYPGSAVDQAMRVWSESPGRIDPTVLELVQRSRERVSVTLITNATSRLALDLERLDVREVFDAVVNSSEVGAAKPDARIYRAALRAAGAAPENTLFVDDSPGHVAGASRLGMVGHVYQGVEQLRQVLRHHAVVDE